MLLYPVLMFASGAIYEALCVFWVHFSERGSARGIAVVSMLAKSAELVGIGATVHDWRLAPFFIAGYGFGSAAAVTMKRRWMPTVAAVDRTGHAEP